jgi:cytochrome c oxidase assembly factor CtaG
VAGGLIAGTYSGPPELTLGRSVTSWTLDLPVLVAVLAAAGLYVGGMRQRRRAGQPWPAGPAVAFLAVGLGTVVIATMSFLGVYQDVLFWIRAVQNVLLLLVAPLFLALGRPLSLLIAARPVAGARAQAMVRSRAARVLTFPAITAMVLVIVPFLLYFTAWYEAGLRSDPVRELTYAALMAPGLVFFWTLLRVDPVPKAYPYLVSLWVTGAEVVGDAVLGLAVIADQHLIAGSYYQALARPWGPTLRADQVIGGGALWILGDLVGLPFLAAQLIQMIREDEQEAAEVDAELDASAAVASAEGAEAAGMAPATMADGQPWWESDDRFTGRFRQPGSE